jgi:hypothetical protein
MRWLKLPALAALAVVVYSELATDRLASTQILWWIPRSMLTLPALAWLLAMLAATAWTARRSVRLRDDARAEARRLVWWSAAALALAAALFLRDWRPGQLRAARGETEGPRLVGDSPGEIRLVHWNAACLALPISAGALDALLATGADVILVTDQCWMLAKGGAERVRARGYEIVQAGKFTAFTRVPVREARPLLASRGRTVGRFVFVARAGELVVDAVDLPSETTLPRAQLMRTLAAELSAAEPAKPDLYIGDFNITRGSASLLSLAPDHRDAFLVAGRGWGGSYPRTAPFWAIDLALVRAPWSAVEYGVIDLGAGRHRAQAVTLQRE